MSELLTACMDLLETGADLASDIPTHSSKPEQVAKQPAQTRVRRPSTPRALPRWVLASRLWFDAFTGRHILGIIFWTWAILVVLGLAKSLLASLLTLHLVVLAGIVVFHYEEAYENRGWRGPVYASMIWVLTSMAIAVPLFFPVEATVELTHWLVRLVRA